MAKHGKKYNEVKKLVDRTKFYTLDEAIELVKKHDHDLDPRSVREFCQFFGYSEKEFWEIIDNNYNQDIFERKNNGTWKLKNSKFI